MKDGRTYTNFLSYSCVFANTMVYFLWASVKTAMEISSEVYTEWVTEDSSSVMLLRVEWQIAADVSEDSTAFKFRVQHFYKVYSSRNIDTEKRQYDSTKRR